MRKFLAICAVLLVLILAGLYVTYRTSFSPVSHMEDEPEFFMQTEGKQIYRLTENGREPFEIKGVDMGTGIPGHFATEYAVDYDTYTEWFRMIQEMNANVIRIYTISDPVFYEAFYDFNVNNPDPIYLIHGVWVDDDVIRAHNDAYADQFIDVFKDDCRTMVDVIHGRRSIGYNSRIGHGNFNKDISPWVIGYILGVEWDPDLVLYTDDIQEHQKDFTGNFLYTDEDASAFEAMLARVGDETLTYEMRKYGEQRLLAFSNWPETDPFFHVQWRVEKNSNLAHIDVEHIHAKDNLKTGMFASYHIYPYYPVFMEFEEPYKSYVDETGSLNPYRCYLQRINEHHSIPVVISEFGQPSSRGIARANLARNMHQGHLTEKEQANNLVTLYEDIRKSGCAGACVFAWQDEWFKRTWNTWPGVNLARNAYWSDYQTNEQSFGLITFDPGKEVSKVYVDGDVSEWSDTDWIYQDRDLGLKADYDEKFVYFMVELKGRQDSDVIYLPIDITPNSGATRDRKTGLKFERPVDFLIRLGGRDNSEIMVQEYYDLLYATERREIWGEDAFIHPPRKDSDKFNLIQQFLRGKIMMIDGSTLDPWLFPTGELRHGDANPNHKNFDSLADFNMNGDYVEIRLPWTLFNFSDPSMMQIHDDYYKYYGVQEMDISEMQVSMQVMKDGKRTVTPFRPFELKGWGNHPTWHTRTKQAYYAMQQAYGEVD